MSQATKITAALIIAFVIYATMKGSLRNYLMVLGIVN